MQITITTTLDISEENLGLIPLITAGLGYSVWTTVQDAGADTSQEAFIKDYLTKDFKERINSLILPTVESHFGGVMKTQSDAIQEQLLTAVSANVEITN